MSRDQLSFINVRKKYSLNKNSQPGFRLWGDWLINLKKIHKHIAKPNETDLVDAKAIFILAVSPLLPVASHEGDICWITSDFQEVLYKAPISHLELLSEVDKEEWNSVTAGTVYQTKLKCTREGNSYSYNFH